MSQAVGVDVVPRCVDSDSVGVEAGESLAQESADGGIVSKDLIEDIETSHRILFEIADDGDILTLARED